jgi:3-dehydroquinate dehydratase
MIELTGLTKRQMVLADILWSIEEWDMVEVFIKSLSKRDRIDCEGIIEMMTMSMIEELGNKDFTEANKIIEKVKSI